MILLMFSFQLNAAVVVSIKPLHSISAFLLEGVDQPVLLMDQPISPHHFQLKPSHVKALHHASLIIWNGENVESSLSGVLQKTSAIPQLKMADLFEPADHHQEEEHHEHQDQHFWLDPIKMQKAARVIAQKLIELYPDHKKQINNNLQHWETKLHKLHQKTGNRFEQQKNRRSLVLFHNALAQFNQRYGLQTYTAIQRSAHQLPSLKHILQVKQQMKSQPKICLLKDKQMPQKWLDVLNDHPSLKVENIDPAGLTKKAGKNFYFELIDELGSTIQRCLY